MTAVYSQSSLMLIRIRGGLVIGFVVGRKCTCDTRNQTDLLKQRCLLLRLLCQLLLDALNLLRARRDLALERILALQ